MSEGAAIVGAALPARWRLRRTHALLALVLLLCLLPHLPGLQSDFGRSLLTQMAIAAVFALSFNLLFGHTGLLSFGHAVYFGVGGYAAIHLMRAINHGLPVPMLLAPLAGAVMGALIAVPLGCITTRRAGTIFALITLGVGELVHAATFMVPSVFGGEEGVTASRTKAAVDLGVSLSSQLQVYYAVSAWTVLAAMAMYAFTRTPAGRICNAVRDNPERAEFLGYDTQRVRLIAVIAAGLFAGLAGGLHALNYEIVAADAVGAQRSGTVLIMAYIGGSAHFAGPVLGAIVITWLQSSLSGYTSAWLLYLGVFFVLMILYAPAGLWSVVAAHARMWRSAQRTPVLRSYALAAAPVALVFGGAIVAIEMSYRLSTQPELGTRMRLLWMRLDAGTPWPWLAAAAAITAGALLLHGVAARIRRAWEGVRPDGV